MDQQPASERAELTRASGPRILIGRALPITGDVLFASTDENGTPGELNSLVLRHAGYPPNSLHGNPGLASRGIAELKENGRSTVFAIVTVSSSHDTNISLRGNLLNALSILTGPAKAGGLTIWLPLMGTGAGGLERRESFQITIRALQLTLAHLASIVSEIHISCDARTPLRQLESFVKIARDALSDSGARIVTDGDAPPSSEPSREPKGTTPADRIFTDNSRTHVDATAGPPGMDFVRIAERLVKVIQDVAEPTIAAAKGPSKSPHVNVSEARLTIGLFAPWGAGKSTLIRELRRQFEANEHLVIFINPWKWDGKGDLHDYVRGEVEREFAAYSAKQSSKCKSYLLLWSFRWKAFRRKYQRLFWFGFLGLCAAVVVGSQIGPLLTITEGKAEFDWTKLLASIGLSAIAPAVVWLLPKAVGWLWDRYQAWNDRRSSSDRSATLGAVGLSTAYQDISTLVIRENEGARPFIFFFDDLDRCAPDRVVMVLESVHSLTASGCVVFLACDDEYVVAAINTHYEKIAQAYANGADFGRRFIEKIVQIPFRLPLVRTGSIFELGLATKGEEAPGKIEAPPPQKGTDTTSEDPKVAPPPSSGAEARPESSQPKLDEIRLSQIIGELLGNAVEPLGLNIRQVKSIANTLKLYLGIAQSRAETDARQLAAFVFADKFDPIWLDSIYFDGDRKGTAIGSIGPLDEALAAMVGNQKEDLLDLYHLLGRRPKVRPVGKSQRPRHSAKGVT